jgi:gluconate kinase
MSYDQYQYYSLFDQIILLEADAATIRQRLKSRTNASFGKQAAELKFILSHLDDLQSTALAAGAVAIDATRPLETVADCVTEALA